MVTLSTEELGTMSEIANEKYHQEYKAVMA